MLKINDERLKTRLMSLAEIGRDPSGGWTRPSFTPQYTEACELVASWMKEAGMSVRFDAAGNMIGRLEGSDPSLPPAAMGSHIDTVRNGGMFDGTVGTLGALEAVQTIYESGMRPVRPVEILVFAEEEGSRFGAGLLGSKAVAGVVGRDFIFTQKDFEGRPIAETYREYGFDPERFGEARRNKGDYHCYFELHIEQSHVLYSSGDKLGVIEGIAGYIWLNAVIRGQASHAGATPMDFRHDALIPAAMIIQETERVAREVSPTTVAAVGKMEIVPNMINVVPGEVRLSFDIRDMYTENVERAAALISERFREICASRGVEGEIHESIRSVGTLLPKPMTDIVEEAVRQTGAPYRRMMSGAAHDAQMMARITDAAMIFVPSIDGISHDPREKTDYPDIALGAQALLNALLIKLG